MNVQEREQKVAAAADLRFRMLLGDEQWASLPKDTQRRFSKRLCDKAAAVYVGQVTELKMSRVGRWLANLLRLVGAPLPICKRVGGPSVVYVTEDSHSNGQIWTRVYTNNHQFPQVIHSAKRFAGPTGLEEYIGYGITMALRVSVQQGVLVFESDGYSFGVGALRFKLPAFLTPGNLTVTHTDLGNRSFDFGLELHHKYFGCLMTQHGRYREEDR